MDDNKPANPVVTPPAGGDMPASDVKPDPKPEPVVEETPPAAPVTDMPAPDQAPVAEEKPAEPSVTVPPVEEKPTV